MAYVTVVELEVPGLSVIWLLTRVIIICHSFSNFKRPDADCSFCALLNMPRPPTTCVTEPKEWFLCLVAYCPSKFRTINGRMQHINAIHTHNELQQDDNHFPVVSGWPRIPSPQSETTDELNNQALNDFELPGASSSGFDQVVNSPKSGNATHIQPQLEEHPEFFSPSSPPFHRSNSWTPFQEPEPMQTAETKHHPFINGRYI
jgi:hypothetical protein